MKKETARKIMQLQEMAKQDLDYQQLCLEFAEADANYLRIRDSMTEEQRDAVEDYMGVCWRLYWTMLRLACE